MIRGGDGANSMSLTDHVPPHDLHAERGVIGAVLYDNAVIPDLRQLLPRADQFYRGAHQTLWREILAMVDEGKKVDFVTLNARLDVTEGGLDRVVGFDYLLEIRDCVCHTVDAREHARIVANHAALRDTIETSNEVIRDCYAFTKDASQIISDAVDTLKGIDLKAFPENTLKAGSLVDDVLDRIEARRVQDTMFGVPTGFAEFDSRTDGLQSEDFCIVAARPSMGKTSFALNVCDTACVSQGYPTLFLSLEMGNPLLVERMLAARSRINLKTLRTGGDLSIEEQVRLANAATEIKAAPLYVVKRPSRVITEIVNEIRRYHARHLLSLIVLDYIQLVQSDNTRDSEVQALTKISAALKGLTREIAVPIMALSQLNRAIEGRSKEERRPRLADIRGSGSIEQDADLVLFLDRPERYDKNDRPGEADAILAKNRNGEPWDFVLDFDKHLTRFRDHEDRVTYRPEDAPFDPPDDWR